MSNRTAKVLTKAWKLFDSSSILSKELSILRVTLESFPIKFGLTYVNVFPSILQAIVFCLKVKMTFDVVIIEYSVKRFVSTDNKVGYAVSIMMTKRIYTVKSQESLVSV